MCINPGTIFHPDGVQYGTIRVPCKRCWQCIKLRTDDYVGRCLAEAAYSRGVTVMTMTYRDEPERGRDLAHRRIVPRHVQEFFRSLRDRHHSLRYFVSGEIGSLNGRAHFHAVIFWQSAPPDWPDNRDYRWHLEQWRHGFVSTEQTHSESALRYVVKYINKQTGWFSLSKKPPLGALFFRDLAALHADLGVIPHRWQYRPPGAADGRDYLMTGATRRDYLIELARLKGLDITALPDRGAAWVQKSCFKIDEWFRDRRLADLPLSEQWDRLVAEVESTRPTRVRQVIVDYAYDVPLTVGDTIF